MHDEDDADGEEERLTLDEQEQEGSGEGSQEGSREAAISAATPGGRLIGGGATTPAAAGSGSGRSVGFTAAPESPARRPPQPASPAKQRVSAHNRHAPPLVEPVGSTANEATARSTAATYEALRP